MEWPKDALTAVASEFLANSTVSVELTPEAIQGVVNTCVEMQESAYQLTERYRLEALRNFYITPTSYLELIGSFLRLLGEKRNSVTTLKGRYDTGISKLDSTSAQVLVMQKELEELQPILKKTAVENSELIKVITVRKEEASVVQQNVAKEEAEAKAQADLAKAIQAECQKDLSAAMPALEAAMDALSRLSKADVVEVKAMNNPPTGVVLVAEALCIMFEVPPKKEKSPDGKTKIENYWEPAKKSLFGDMHAYGKEGVRFYTKQKSVMQRWPESIAKGAEFVMPTSK
jgi:dynein heavy chain